EDDGEGQGDRAGPGHRRQQLGDGGVDPGPGGGRQQRPGRLVAGSEERDGQDFHGAGAGRAHLAPAGGGGGAVEEAPAVRFGEGVQVEAPAGGEDPAGGGADGHDLVAGVGLDGQPAAGGGSQVGGRPHAGRGAVLEGL